MTTYKRSRRVSGLIMAEISDLLRREIKDPRIGFATITKVEVSDDLRHARVGVSVLGDDSQKSETIKGLTSASGFIRGELGRRLRLRYVPEIVFTIDKSLEYSARISKVIDDLARQSDEG